MLERVKGFLLDLDGVTWFGNTLAPGAQAFWQFARERELPLAFVSNASATSRVSICDKLERLGLAGVAAEQVFPATRAAALYVIGQCPAARVFVIGGEGLRAELQDAGAILVEDAADFVVVGVDRQLTYERLERACDQVLAGAKLVTTNLDGNYPTDRGPKPAAGPFAVFIQMASGQPATLVGKPEAELLRQALAYLGLDAGDAAMVGDSPEADLVAARRAGTRAVMIGDHSAHPLVAELQPDLICRDLGDLVALLEA